MDGNERYGAGPIVIREYDPEWPARFVEERSRLVAILGSVAARVEHVGSTAVPGMAAKPIIDLLVGVDSLPHARISCLPKLQAVGYTYLPQYESWLPGEMLFRKGTPAWTHHVHVLETASAAWDDYILLRDFLRRRADVAGAYADLKRALALVFEDDIAGYRDAKRQFVKALVEKARGEAATST